MVASNPLALVCELTHCCPLHCVYCSNPQELTARTNELSTEIWSRVFREASEAGVMQLDLTGGEPLARPDLSTLIQSARASGLYVNLITSGLPLDEKRLDELIAVGLDHFQLSFQGAREKTASEISGGKSHAQKLRVLDWLKSRRVAVTLNFVVHRKNLDQLEKRFPPKRPLLPFLEKLNQRLPKKWDSKLNRFVPNDDWLLWDFHLDHIRGKHVESIKK